MSLLSRLFHVLFYRFATTSVRALFRIGWRLEVRGESHIPKHGPVILAANHRSFADPPLVGVATAREVHFLAKQELFRFGPFGWLIRQLNAHPLKRSGDVGALRAANRILEQGLVLIVFPEGKRMKTDHLGQPKPGVGMLAAVAKCPIVPTYVHNSGHFMKFRKLRVVFGHPIHVHGQPSYRHTADEVMKQIQKLKDGVLKSEK